MVSEAEIWRCAHSQVAAGRRVVLCTVVQGHGSTPRELGARMLVGELGVIAGTVGGGCGEAEVLVHARKAIAGVVFPASVEIDLSGDLEQTTIQACGGWMRVSLRTFTPDDLSALNTLGAAEGGEGEITLYERFEPKGQEALFLRGPRDEAKGEIPPEVFKHELPNRGQRIETQAGEWLATTVGAAHELIIVGSGHVAQPLCDLAQRVGYHVTILDDRASYVTAERFPGASRRQVGQHAKLLAGLDLHDRTYIVIITRGHQHDRASLMAALKGEPTYIGMIGSKRRALQTLRELRGEGFDEAKLAKVHTPIGLDIGAETPAEIAIAILAEVIMTRRGGKGQALRDLRPKF